MHAKKQLRPEGEKREIDNSKIACGACCGG